MANNKSGKMTVEDLFNMVQEDPGLWENYQYRLRNIDTGEMIEKINRTRASARPMIDTDRETDPTQMGAGELYMKYGPTTMEGTVPRRVGLSDEEVEKLGGSSEPSNYERYLYGAARGGMFSPFGEMDPITQGPIRPWARQNADFAVDMESGVGGIGTMGPYAMGEGPEVGDIKDFTGEYGSYVRPEMSLYGRYLESLNINPGSPHYDPEYWPSDVERPVGPLNQDRDWMDFYSGKEGRKMRSPERHADFRTKTDYLR